MQERTLACTVCTEEQRDWTELKGYPFADALEVLDCNSCDDVPSFSLVHGSDVIDDFVNVLRTIRGENLSFGGQNVLKRTLRPLDLAG